MKINNFFNSIFIMLAISFYNIVGQEKTILITGGAGFIGSNFVKYMFNKYPNYNLIVLDKLTYAGKLDNLANLDKFISKKILRSNRVKFHHGCITDQELVNDLMKKSDWVVHFAAETHVEKSIYENTDFFNSNVIGTNCLINALLKSPNVERFLHVSTSEVYGTAETEPMSESHPLNPRSPYAGSKAGADRLVYSYWCTFDIPAVIIRPFNNYGPKQHEEKVIPKFITSALKKQPLTVHGSGNAKRDYLYVMDHCKALDKALHLEDFSKIKNQVINLGTGKSTSVLELAKVILKELNLPETYIQFVDDRPGQVDCHIADYSKAKNLLNWEPEINLEKGIKKTINFYSKRIN